MTKLLLVSVVALLLISPMQAQSTAPGPGTDTKSKLPQIEQMRAQMERMRADQRP
jgi:hypothetical protein